MELTSFLVMDLITPLSFFHLICHKMIEAQEQKKGIRTPGWRGSQLSVKTRTGEDIAVEYSNHLWQCDHTWVDMLAVDIEGEIIGRPWLTMVIDTYSRCIMGLRVGFDAPSSQVVALALRHAILPRHQRWEAGLLAMPDLIGERDLVRSLIGKA